MPDASNGSLIATTQTGALLPVGAGDGPDCEMWLKIPGTSSGIGDGRWFIFALPDITNTKDATYSDATILGRASPVSTYSFSSARKINVTFHLYSTSEYSATYNVNFIRACESAVNPVYSGTYLPPPIGLFKCGPLFRGVNGGGLNVKIGHVSYNLSPEMVWPNMIPIHVALGVDMDVLYPFYDIPGCADVVRGDY